MMGLCDYNICEIGHTKKHEQAPNAIVDYPKEQIIIYA